LAGPSQPRVMVLVVVAATRRLLGVPGEGAVVVVVGVLPMVAVNSGVVTPPPRIE